MKCKVINMFNTLYILSLFLVSWSVLVDGTDYFVILTSNAPIVQGAEVAFSAKLYTTNGEVPEGKFEYEWKDNGLIQHTRKVQKNVAEDQWSVSYYPASEYPPGPYEMQVIVNKCWSIFCVRITSKRLEFNITVNLNGHVNLIQDHIIRAGQYVASNSVVSHEIALSPPDYIFLKNNATSILTYWFVDCVYYGMTSNYTFNYKYDQPDSEHLVEALVIAGFEPITTPAPTTTMAPTTHKPNTTTMAPTTQKPNTTTVVPTTQKPNTTTVIPTMISTHVTTMAKLGVDSTRTQAPPLMHRPSNVNNRSKREANATLPNGKMLNVGANISFPYVCLNQSSIAPDPKKTYGYFSRKIIVKTPVSNITVTGNNWLKHGDILSLQVKCNGSPPFSYCMNYYHGPHNTTQNETCDFETADVCEFKIVHYYNAPTEYSIIIVIKNDVAKLVSPVAVNVYKVEKRSQLSVIVVPVSFSLVAVVLIVFGVAYYIQNRRRFTVEVANFDFGQQYSDLEYKTFRERLRDSISHAFTTMPKTEQQEPTLWPPGRKYGSMT